MSALTDLTPEERSALSRRVAGFLALKPSIIGLHRSGEHPALPCPECGEPVTDYRAVDVRGEPGPVGWHTAFHCKCGFGFLE